MAQWEEHGTLDLEVVCSNPMLCVEITKTHTQEERGKDKRYRCNQSEECKREGENRREENMKDIVQRNT